MGTMPEVTRGDEVGFSKKKNVGSEQSPSQSVFRLKMH